MATKRGYFFGRGKAEGHGKMKDILGGRGAVRWGAKDSMPGMMDTILNLGLNDKTVQGLGKKTKNERFACDSYRRFLMMFSAVVLGIDKENFEHLFDQKKKERGAASDLDMTAEDLKEVFGKITT